MIVIQVFFSPTLSVIFRSNLTTAGIPSRIQGETAVTMPSSACRQNYAAECEAGVNKQINMELYACYTYQSMSFYFDRDDVALPGFARYFKKASDEERVHAERLMKYQNTRGGRIVLQVGPHSHGTV